MIPLHAPGTGDGASHPFKVGDLVHNGNGATVWRLTGFWHNGPTEFASLTRPDRAWVNASCVVDRLRRAPKTPTQRRREGKVVQQPTTAAELADGGSPSDPLPVAANTEKVAGHSPVVVAGRRPTCPTCGRDANPGPPVWCLHCDEPATS